MNDKKTRLSDKLSRRNALRMLGLTAAVGYAAPVALMVSSSSADAWEGFGHRTRRFRTNRFSFRTRRFRTERFRHRFRTDRFALRHRTRRYW